MDYVCINPNASNEADLTNTLRLNRAKYAKKYYILLLKY